MQLRKLVTHVMEENQWFQFGGNRVLHFLEKINDNRIIVLNSQEKHRITKNSKEILQVFYTGATTVLVYSDFAVIKIVKGPFD